MWRNSGPLNGMFCHGMGFLWSQKSKAVARLPSVQLPPHIKLVVVLSAVRKQDDLTLSSELSGQSHAQCEGP